MLGVILWSDAAAQKAVLWCEDQGDLAYLSGAHTGDLPETFFQIGDLLEVDVRTHRNMRLASNPRCVQASVGREAIDGLAAVTAQICTTLSDTAHVIPFPAKGTAPHPMAARTASRKRLG